MTFSAKKLEHYDVKQRKRSWFQSYLANKKQCCKVGGVDSDIGEVEVGVPQGSGLRPLLLFLIYINGLPSAVQGSNASVYADDASLGLKVKSGVKNKKKVVETRSLTKYDKISFINDLRQINWSAILSPLAENPNLMASTFQEIFESILDIHAPLKKRRVRSESAPWLNQSIRNLMKERDLAKRIAKKSPEKWSVYKQLRNKVTKEIKVAIETHYRGLIEENKDNPKKMWKTIKDK